MDPRNVTQVDEQLTYTIIQDIRNKADISYEKSKLALCAVLSQLETILPDESSQDFVLKLLTYIPQSEHVDVKVLDSTEDSVVLTDVLNKLVEIKEDAQQRSWQLHEDEHIILDLVEKLRALLSDADSAICNRVLARDGYSAMDALVSYYQMETRWSIRQVLLEVFVLSCGLHPLLITSLLNSVLPQELGRDILSDSDEFTITSLISCILIPGVCSLLWSSSSAHYFPAQLCATTRARS
uniref:NCK-interacting protein with SH3 domain n=1 Tax=Cacopsylla melanoneura TaxID=428564 RepID=A0A8D8VDS7_9HEMI